jgi:hypothetical protein
VRVPHQQHPAQDRSAQRAVTGLDPLVARCCNGSTSARRSVKASQHGVGGQDEGELHVQFRTHRAGAHRTYLSGKARIAGAALVAALAIGGGAVTVTTAIAQPADQEKLGVLGEVRACGSNYVPTSMEYSGTQGDRGNSSRPLNNGGVQILRSPKPVRYAFQLNHVGRRGEWVDVTIRCTGAPGRASTHHVRFFAPGPGKNGVISKDL